MQLYPGALLTAALLAGHGLRKGSLAVSGALAALAVGYISLATPLRSCGITLLAFYFVGSRATRVGHEIKARLETEYNAPTAGTAGGKQKGGGAKAREGQPSTNTPAPAHKAKAGGQRDAIQVLCNSLLGAACALLFRVVYGESTRACIFSSTGVGSTIIGSPRFLFLAMLGHYACCMGDTLASELGILAKRPPRLILPPFRVVPPGTNGALSLQGTLGSLIGGAWIGLVSSVSLVLLDSRGCYPSDSSGLLSSISSLSLSSSSLAPQAPSPLHIIGSCIALGAAGGLGGSAIDSLLGATLQRTWYNAKTGQVLVGRLPAAANERKTQSNRNKAKNAGMWDVVTGSDVLSNSAVNVLSSSATALLIALLGSAL